MTEKSTLMLSGYVSVTDFGAVSGNDDIDNSVAFMDAAKASRKVLIPPGVYNFTSGVILSNGVEFEAISSRGVGGDTSGDPKLVTLKHSFDGDFFTFNGKYKKGENKEIASVGFKSIEALSKP